MADGYTEDFHAWALAQADALRRRSANEMDWENLAEEIESLGKSEARELASRLEILCQHLLKWAYQPDHRSRSWEGTIRTQQRAIEEHLNENPSLRPKIAQKLIDIYPRARTAAAYEMNMLEVDLPLDPPFHIADVLEPNFWPSDSI